MHGCHSGYWGHGPRIRGGAFYEDHRYVGFCRCGRGPHAYYIGDDGKVHSPFFWDYRAKEEEIRQLESEVDKLREELNKALGEIERLKGGQPKDV